MKLELAKEWSSTYRKMRFYVWFDDGQGNRELLIATDSVDEAEGLMVGFKEQYQAKEPTEILKSVDI